GGRAPEHQALVAPRRELRVGDGALDELLPLIGGQLLETEGDLVLPHAERGHGEPGDVDVGVLDLVRAVGVGIGELVLELVADPGSEERPLDVEPDPGDAERAREAVLVAHPAPARITVEVLLVVAGPAELTPYPEVEAALAVLQGHAPARRVHADLHALLDLARLRLTLRVLRARAARGQQDSDHHRRQPARLLRHDLSRRFDDRSSLPATASAPRGRTRYLVLDLGSQYDESEALEHGARLRSLQVLGRLAGLLPVRAVGHDGDRIRD